MTDKTQLTVLEGGRDKRVIINTLSVEVMSNTLPSLPIDVRVFEEDTYLVLTVDPIMRYKEEHPIRLMNKVAESKPNKPGTIVINNTSWYAVIHDVDRDPTWDEKWIRKAYKEILILGEIKRIRRIGLPLLGCVHGRFAVEQSLEMLVEGIQASTFQSLNKLLILVPHTECIPVWEKLKETITASRI